MLGIGKWFTLGVLSISVTVSAGEWPKWLGPDGTGIATDKIADQWPADGPRKIWSQKVGLGFTSAVGLDGKIYFLAMQGSNDVLRALDADKGTVLWAESYPVGHKPSDYQATNRENGLPVPNASPTIDGERIYTYGGGGDLVCRNLADGKAVWQLNILDQTGATNLRWNTSSSPLISGKLLYVQGGKDGPVAVALDKVTGKIVWKSETGLGGYAAPILINVEGTPQLIIFGGNTLFAFDPQSGKTMWKQPWQTSYDVNATTPIYKDGHLFITSGYGHGCAMLSVTPTSAKIEWKGKVGSKFQPCILDDGKLYANSGSILKCLKWPEKTEIWSSRDVELDEGGSFVIDGNQMIAMSEKGTLSLVHLEADGPKVVSQVKLFDFDNVWTSPVIYHGKLYVKGKEELVCLDVSAK